MSRDEYYNLCLSDAISALEAGCELPMSIELGHNHFIYPRVALERLKSLKRIDKTFPKK